MKKTLLMLIYVLTTVVVKAQLNPQSISIPMRDGKSLSGDLYLPNTQDSFPTIFIFTSYGKVFYKSKGLPFGINQDISKSKYAFLIVDWRCRFASMSACAQGSSHGEDGYDVIEWAASQTWSNGKIGTWGPSALGNVQFMTAQEKPPHLVCAVPEVASPLLEYNKYHHGGVMEAASFKTLNEKLFPGSYDLVIKNPYYNNVWKFAEASTEYHKHVEVPMLLIAGWYDHNTVADLEMLDLLTAHSGANVKDKHKILIGPWVHGGTGQASLGTSFQGDYSFPNAEKWNDSFTMVFFDYYLRDMKNGYENNAKYTYYQIGDNLWHTDANWPPKTIETKTFYLNENGKLTTSLPVTSGLTSTYDYDPQDPSPTVGGKTLSDDLDQGPYDQSKKVENRNDVVLFTSETLTEDITVNGKIKIKLNVSSNRIDTDFAIRLTEVYPDGRSIQIEEDILRMRFRNGFTLADTAFMRSGEKYAITLTLDDLAYTFKIGNKMRLIVSSSNYPLYNRNMNTGGEMYPDNKVDTLVNPLVATNSIHYGSDQVSTLELPIGESKNTSVKKVSTPSFYVYPNPVNQGVLRIIGINNPMELALYTMDGKEILKESIYSEATGVDVSNVENGMYIIRIRDLQGKEAYQKVRILK